MRLRKIQKRLYRTIECMKQQQPRRWRRLRRLHVRTNIVTAYVDCSGRGDGHFGLGVCLIIERVPRVFSVTMTDMLRPNNTVAGELWAVHYALKSIVERRQDILGHSDSVTRVVVFSDLRFIERLFQGNRFASYKRLQHALQEINEMKNQIELECGVKPEILYLAPSGQSGNPFYSAAHQAARWAMNTYAIRPNGSKRTDELG
jgi:hypothetical protein